MGRFTSLGHVFVGSHAGEHAGAARRYAVAALLVVGALGLLLVLMGPVAWWLAGDTVSSLSGKDEADGIDDVRRTLLQGAAGVLAAGALLFTARTYVLAREGHVTDRYTKATDQLGAETIDQRVAGIYALERILRDSWKDHAAVVDVLAAFVALHSRAGPETSSAGEKRREYRSRADVQAALGVLGRRPGRPHLEHSPVRLSDAHLQYTMMRGGDLSCARLRRAHLENARWEGADLRGARMRGAHMKRVDLEGADLRHASLERADLRKAKLVATRLDHADLGRARLDGAKLTGASLAGAHLARAQGEPASPLTEEQLSQLHCRPSDPACDSADASTRSGPCSRFEW